MQKAGADLNTPNQDGTTPLFAAEAGGNEEAANVLKEFGAKGWFVERSEKSRV